MIADQPMVLPAGGDIKLTYRIVIADGAWTREDISAKAAVLI